MLLGMDKTDRNNSIYECDRCKITMKTYSRIGIFIQEPYSNTKKKWDLCSKCYKMLCKGISKEIKQK